MGLLRRLFSIGSKKNKKQRPSIAHDVPLPEQPWAEVRPVEDEEHEAAVSRLLRSSSARYVASSELDYATLPPLPHPINRVVQTPASSTISLGSASVTQRGTYNVTVYGKKKHPSMEFGDVHQESEDNAGKAVKKNKRTSLHPVDDSRVLRLRSDPSVASLIELYDDHGKLSADAFSNSPPNTPGNKREEGRAQVRRNGSTLRQLLGASSSLNSRGGNESGSVEGDISWAERFLAETEATSSQSSLVLQTPTAPFNAQFPEPEISFVTDGSLANITFDNPAISSMEVELSMTIETSEDLDNLDDDVNKKSYPYSNSNPSTPQRASQVFGFLTKGKQSKPAEDLDRSLPEVPSCFSTPSEESVPHENPNFKRIPPLFEFNPSHFPAMPTTPHVDDTPRNIRPQSVIEESPTSREPRSTFSDDSHDYRLVPRAAFHAPSSVVTFSSLPNDNVDDKKNAIKVIMNGPTKVIVTAPTPSTNHNGPSRLLRGPRAPPRKMSNGGTHRRRSALVELSNSPPTSSSDPFMPPSPRKKAPSHRRSNSQSSAHSSCGSCEAGPEYVSRPKKLERTLSGSHRKENQHQLSLAVKTELPSTPLRSNTAASRSLLRTVVQNAMFRPSLEGMIPSPASSSEMSPYGRQIMMDVRQQRMKAREADRLKHGSRYAAERDAQRL